MGLGDPIQRLSFLGPGQSTSLEFVDFPEKGLTIGADDNGLVCDFSLFFGHGDETSRGRFLGSIGLNGRDITLDSNTTEQSILNMLGSPYWRDQDESEIILFYERHGYEWQIEFGNDQGLKTWIILSDPLMSDREKREAYGVTKPWPPG